MIRRLLIRMFGIIKCKNDVLISIKDFDLSLLPIQYNCDENIDVICYTARKNNKRGR